MEHPSTGWKTSATPNWPSRAFRMPDVREAGYMLVWFSRAVKSMKNNIRKEWEVLI